MPRAPVKLAQSREPIPDWWEGEFHARQSNTRAKILIWLKRSGQALSMTMLRSHITLSSRREFEHALAALLDQGLVVRRDRREPSRLTYGPRTVICTYYDLAERPPEGA
jgi:DNA-binding transcriptional ArsR family regulator